MGFFLFLAVSVVASAPDAGATARSEARATVASCAWPSVLDEANGTTAELVETPAGRAVRFHETNGPMGSGRFVTERRWLVVPKTCRTLALQLDCAGGNPNCSSMVIHRPGQPPTGAERALLLSWLGGSRRDPNGSGLELLGMHRGRAWLKVPVFMDPGFSLLAIDVESGAAWHLGLERTATFDPAFQK